MNKKIFCVLGKLLNISLQDFVGIFGRVRGLSIDDDDDEKEDDDDPDLGEGSLGVQDKGRGREENLLGPETSNL